MVVSSLEGAPLASSLKGPAWTRGDSLGSPPQKQPRPELFPASEPKRESTRLWDGEERMSKGSRISDLGCLTASTLLGRKRCPVPFRAGS